MAYVKRELEHKLLGWLDEREIIAIRGPRQCGKTTLLNRLREILEERGVDEKDIRYISFEDDLARMEFEKDPKEFISSHISGKKTFFLMDEVQNVKDVGKKLKAVFDGFANIKIIMTGSSSFDLTNIGKYLVGRVLFFDLMPFSFLEFLRAKNERYERIYKGVKVDVIKPVAKETVFLEELNKLLHEYLTFGAYPRAVLASGQEKKKEILKGLFTTYVEKDIVSVYGARNRDKTIMLLKTLSDRVGGMLNYEEISRTLGIKYREVGEIMQVLKDSFVVSLARPFHKNLSSELRKNPKVYFVDVGMRNYLANRIENPDFGALYENFIYNQLRMEHKVNYWRTTAKTEIDFVVDEKIPVEVKTSAKKSRALLGFIRAYKPGHALIPNLKAVGRKKADGCKIIEVPIAYF